MKASVPEAYDLLMPRKTLKAQRKEEAFRLRKVREKLGLTQAQLAAKFRVVPSAITHWESGTRSIPGPVTVLIEIFENNEDSKIFGTSKN